MIALLPNQSKEASLVYRSSTRVCVRNCVSSRRPEFECSGPQLEGPEFECSGPQLEGPEFEYSELSLKTFEMDKHVPRMDDSRNAYRVLRRRWEDNIKVDLRELVMIVETGLIFLRIGTDGRLIMPQEYDMEPEPESREIEAGRSSSSRDDDFSMPGTRDPHPLN
ncbi:hypothetical protein ANN_15200 [Periplaneta americana]|uniref:Uncharacterized protein n=1 Tax=Periplaneta americana TaxID=6978 RepID=A0ABQ8SFP8_PERAM|nr:hypothetical protein ANN_15200 [Periplaneta americana]